MKSPILQRLSLHRRKTYIIILCLLFTTILFFTLPQLIKSPSSRETYRQQQLQLALDADSFDSFCQALFRYEVTSDSITTAYLLRNPDKYNIPQLSPVLSSFVGEEYKTAKTISSTEQGTCSEISMLLDKMDSFSSDALSSEEQITFTLLQNTLKQNLQLQSYPYYDELLGSSTGVPGNLPVTLSEYPLNTKEDVKTYLSLLKQIPAYFQEVLEYETLRDNSGLQVPPFVIEEAVSTLTPFVESLKTDENCFLQTFDERINELSSLSNEEKQAFITSNEEAVKRYLLPAYESILTYLNKQLTLSDAWNPDTAYGTSSLPNGTSYYELLVSQNTGSNDSVDTLIRKTDQLIADTFSNVLTTATMHPEVYFYYCEHPLESHYESPQSMLESLSLKISEDYPILTTTPSYSVKTVSKSLQDSLSPAFYMLPALDDFENHTIYINPSYNQSTGASLFTTLAHEGFPGHLYQTVYFNETKPLPLRHILDYPGYVEGWATYVEIDSFQYLDYPFEDQLFCSLYQWETILSLALSARVDMGVNYENWTLNDTIAFFEEHGLSSQHAKSLYAYVVEAPANYLRYFIGYMEITELKNAYRLQTMEHYSEKEFHEKLLDIGPADFETISTNLLIP